MRFRILLAAALAFSSVLVVPSFADPDRCCQPGTEGTPGPVPACPHECNMGTLPPPCSGDSAVFWNPGTCNVKPGSTCSSPVIVQRYLTVYSCRARTCVYCRDCVWNPWSEEWEDLPGYECGWRNDGVQAVNVPDCAGGSC